MKDKFDIEDIKRIHLNKGDVLKVTVGECTSSQEVGVIHKMLSNMFPNNEVLVVTKGIELEIVEGGNK